MIDGIEWYFFEYALCMIEMVLCYIALKTRLEQRKDVPQYLIYGQLAMSAFIIFIMGKTTLILPVRLIVGYLNYLAIGAFFFKGKYRDKILLPIVYVVCLSFIDLGVANMVVAITGVDLVNSMLASTAYRFIAAIFSKFILFFMIKLIQYPSDVTLKELPTKFWYMTLFVFAISCVSIIGIVEICTYIKENERVGLFLTIITLGIFISNMVIYSIIHELSLYLKNEKDFEVIQYQNEILIKATMEKDDFNKEVRKIWHDFNNHISCIDMLLQMQNIVKARKYISEMNASCEDVYMGIKTGNEIADAVINQKFRLAKNNEIPFVMNGFLGEKINMNQVDLCALLSNSLDNAIEANLHIEDKEKRKIHMNIKPYKDYLLVDIINAVNENLDNTKALKTIKKDKDRHGIGMISMQKIIEKYEGHLEWICQDNEFKLSLMVRVGNK